MDISKVTGRNSSAELQGQGKTSKKSGFSDVLEKCMDGVNPEGRLKEASCAKTEKMLPVSRETVYTHGGVLRQAARVLDVLEEYAQALDSPQRNLKSIDPIVSRLQQELKGLNACHVQQGEDLARIVNQIATTASVEAFKFHRGDYIAS
jgi:hypothetical protein